jgi:hypothetical protein
MQFPSLPINSSLQNNPRYQFSLKSQNIEILPILLEAILENKNDPECNFQHYQEGGSPSQEVHSGLGIFQIAAVAMETVNVCQNL